MKILHIVAGDLTGGASRGAYWLHLGLKELGIDSKIITNSKETFGDKNVISVTENKKSKLIDMIRSQLDMFPTVFYQNRKKVIFSTGFVGFDFTKTREYKEADIIHLHWINNGFINMRHLSKISKPVIWTMRDMWPMTGGCHCSMECEKYQFGCGGCTQLGSSYGYDLSKIVLNRKIKYLPKNIKMVGISNWLSETAKKSLVMKNFDVKTIHNNINTKDFYPIDKKSAKEILGLPIDKKIILTGAQNVNDIWKGFDKFLEATKWLDKDNCYLCFFGRLGTGIIDNLGFQYMNFGFLHDTISLRLLYSAADVFVAPSLMDAFGKTLAESMACGTPVVCFNATGPKDIVDHQLNGYKATPFDSHDLANGINWVLDSPEYTTISQNTREKVLGCFDSKVVARQYIELYKCILK
ncbi:glycosyltransferase family 4 protein [Methanoplanus endosymbiosus]|uniref:Glycosyltransferase family 4 protein n=1 Tax=Methanoplanus endosymbiosus TaxID=33865 RepID=A0A9E7PNJ9_9EURY|nr:glycosyltransferase family 4 protein [Methanoplanus endosymbiosus]UUX92244.1 glycosyltransferase family 4 protein [Methanoplanus endosymbiosus]